ncbi:HutD/Ves family protein [Zobellella maritima]|uniref:HutD/Ves family protein n=1 Tax=Zobellella maritima TaxID=2059725 RepID=UPI000E306859|nr:HutD family protein [Zobellella maritima]
MARILGPADFTDMPWKNGGGVTRELYRVAGPEGGDEFDFRISMAKVGQSGPFSRYPDIDRVLMLVEGGGFRLSIDDKEPVRLNRPFEPISFAGEQAIHCDLLASTCLDFNVMTNRNWGRSEVEVHRLDAHQDRSVESSGRVFLYLHGTEPRLILLEPGERYELRAAEPVIVVEMRVFTHD